MSGLCGNVSNSKEERMRKIAAWVLVLGMAMSPAVMAADGNDKTSDAKTDKSSTTTNTTKPNGTAPTSTELEAEIEQLRALIKEQADQLAAMKAAMANGSTANAGTTTSTAANSATASNVAAASSDVTTASAASPTMTASAAPAAPASSATTKTPAAMSSDPQAMNASEHSPLSFKIGDANFTPGGFMDFTSVFRTTGTGNGIGTTFNGIPFVNNTAGLAGTTETRFSAQNSRIALKVDAPVAGGSITGYVEADFLGAIAQNANVTSNSDSLRMRLYFGDYRRGKWEVLGGQDWSMLTPSRKGLGVMPNDVFYTQNMDTNYQVGLPWSRQPQFRVMYHPSDEWTMGVSIENPDEFLFSTTNVGLPAAFVPFAGQLDATSGGTLATPPTPNWLPDFIFKVADDHMFGDKQFHIEAAGLLSEFRIFTPASITTTTSMTSRATGGGGSVNMNLELFKNFRLIANSFFSDGGGRYLLGSGPDLVVKQLTTTSPFLPSLVHAYSGIGGFEYQLSKKTLLDAYYGAAYYGRDVQVNPVGGASNLGYGFQGASNSVAAAQNRIIDEYTIGWTQTLWGNPNYGSLKIITQGSYLSRTPWFIPTGQPRDAHLFMVYADLRYTLP
jgi:hypothetical protein